MINELQGVPTPAEVREREQARNPTQNVSQPTLLLMAGFAGAGKTTLTRELQNLLGWVVLNKDDLKLARLVAGIQIKEEGHDTWKAFVEQAGKKAFDELLEQMEEVLEAGKSVIVDTSNEKPSIFEEIKTIQTNLQDKHIHPRLLIILCMADKKTRTLRLNVRGSVFKPYVDETPPVLDDSELPERFRHFFHDDNVIFVDTNHSVNIEYILDKINGLC